MATPTQAEMTQSIINLSDQLSQAMQRFTQLEQRGSRVYGADPPEVDETKSKGGIYDKQIMLPQKLARPSDFRE